MESVSQPVSQSFSQPVSQSISQSVCQSISQSVGQSVSQSVTQSFSQSISQSVRQAGSQPARNTDNAVISTTKVGPPRRLTPERHSSNRHDHDTPVFFSCSMEPIKMAASTSKGPVFFTYAVFLHPAALSSRRCHHAACYLSPGCHRQYRHICRSWYECSENEVLFKEKRSKNRVGEKHRAVEGDATEGNDQTVGQKCFFETKTSKFSTIPNTISSGRYVRLYHTGNRMSSRPSGVQEFVIQFAVIRLLLSGYCQQVIRLLSEVYCCNITAWGYCQQVTVVTLLPWGYCQKFTVVTLLHEVTVSRLLL